MHACVLCKCVRAKSCPTFVARQATWNFPGKDTGVVKKKKKEYWSGLPFPTPGDLSNSGIEPASLASPALAGRFFTTVPPGKPLVPYRDSIVSLVVLSVDFEVILILFRC